MNEHRIDNAVKDFLGESAPASELRAWREALEERMKRLKAEADTDPESRESLRLKIDNLQKQISALLEEESINSFVEETVRASVADLGQVAPNSAPHDPQLPPWANLDIADEGEG